MPVPGVVWSEVTFLSLPGQQYSWRYKLPAGVHCERCVLQVTGVGVKGMVGWYVLVEEVAWDIKGSGCCVAASARRSPKHGILETHCGLAIVSVCAHRAHVPCFRCLHMYRMYRLYRTAVVVDHRQQLPGAWRPRLRRFGQHGLVRFGAYGFSRGGGWVVCERGWRWLDARVASVGERLVGGVGQGVNHRIEHYQGRVVRGNGWPGCTGCISALPFC